MRSVFFDVDGVLIHSIFHADATRRRRWDRHIEEDLGVSPEAFTGFFSTAFTDVVEGRTIAGRPCGSVPAPSTG